MNIDQYNQTIINTLWNHKISFIVFMGFTTMGYLSLPYLNNVQEDLEKKSVHKDQLLNIEEIKERISSFDVILDVRSSEEFDKGHVDVSNVVHIDHKDIIKSKDKSIFKDKNMNKNDIILVYCNSGRRSNLVVKHMVEHLGYNKDKIFLTNEIHENINKTLIKST